jgi:YYY domain-containing protein
MLRKRTWILLLIALGLRLLLLGWDVGDNSASSHPDERQVGFVTEKIEGWFTDPGFYAYGSLHFQAVRATAAIFGFSDTLRGLIVGGRLLSLFASMLAIILGWAMAHRVWGRRTGEIFLLLAAWVPLDLQQSHFSTVEAHHAAWILLALAACFWLATGGRDGAAAGAGVAVGASLAVKVASLALGLPLGLALLLAARHRGALQFLRLGATAAGAGIASFWICQPWAFADGRPPLLLLAATAFTAIALHLASRREGRVRLGLVAIAAVAIFVSALQTALLFGVGTGTVVERFVASGLAWTALNSAYLSGVGEQVAMVMGRADLPYVRVFVDTLPVLYPLRELAAWGWGPMLLLAILAGAVGGVSRLGKRWQRMVAGRLNAGSVLLLILLAWLIPMAVRLSTLYVKFLRYWEPLVVPATLVAAWWLARLPNRYRRRALVAVAGGTILWGLAYSWAFVDPHPHRTASRWLSTVASADQVVAFETWDESIAISPHDGAVQRVELPSYDLPDDEEKVRQWCGELERADWVVLTSNRVYRTVLANPNRFPRTGRLYRLLLTGEAGFEVLTRVSRGPRIFGLRWPVQLADESFVNYEFPQVVILRRTEDVAPEDLAARVERPLPFLEEMGFAELNRRELESLPTIPPVPSGIRQLFDLLSWLVVFVGLGITAWVVLLPVLRTWPDAGLGLALATGWIVPPWLMWMGSELRIWPTGAATASWICLCSFTVGVITLKMRWDEVVAIFKKRRGYMFKVLVVTAVVGFLFLVIRAWNPAIHWGEKPMDFSFLNAFLNAPQWPSGEPWMAGMPLHYYYFGEVLASFPILVAGCSAGVGYNLMSATVPALAAATLASLGLLLARRRRWAAAAIIPLLGLLTGNLAWPFILKLTQEGNLFDLWWATSRVIPGYAIDEYPLWTALFADLHGHFIALPVLIATLVWGWLTVESDGRRWVVASVLCGICAAVLAATNPWDLFILTAALGTGVLVTARRRLAGVGRLTVAAAISLLAAAPFVAEMVAGFSTGTDGRWLFVTDADFAPAWAVIKHFGLFLIPLAALALAILGRRSWMALPSAGIGIIAGYSFGSSTAAMALAAGALFATAAVATADRFLRLAWTLATVGVVAVAACERFTLIDRMNTVFKVYNGVWVLLAVALATALLRSRGGKRRLVAAVWIPLQLVAIVNLPLGIVQGWRFPRMASERPTLDGQAFLATEEPQTWFLVRALQGAARPGEVLAEAAGNFYSEFTRITMHTGGPAVVGWDWHLKQRRQSPEEIKARFTDLEILYAGGPPPDRRAVLDRYRVGWAVVADVERDRYGFDDDDPLRTVPGLLRFAERDGAILYRVLPPGKSRNPVIEPAFEVPAGASVVGALPRSDHDTTKSLALDADGAIVVLRDGSIVELDRSARETRRLEPPPCEVSSVSRSGGKQWAACADGRMWRFGNEAWLDAGRAPGADQVTVGDLPWAWGEGGLWKREGARWRQIYSGRVAAAAAFQSGVAWSEGTRVWTGEGGTPRSVEGGFDELRALAWQGEALWALDNRGLHRSGSAILPWRSVLQETEYVATIAGDGEDLWVVTRNGVLLEMGRIGCSSPWQSGGGEAVAGLNEPRGVAVSSAGWFVVADSFNHRVVWYDDRGICLDTFGREGSFEGGLNEPSGVALANDGQLAIADTWNRRVQIVRTDGTVISVDKNLFGPRDLLWVADGSLVVADTGNQLLLRYAPPRWRREVVVELPAPVVGLAAAGGLLAAATPADGTIAMVDVATGTIVRTLEVPGWSSGRQQEGYLALLPSGELAASAPYPGELWAVDPAGQTPPRLVRSGLPGLTAIALQPDGQLLGSLTWEHRLVRISLED